MKGYIITSSSKEAIRKFWHLQTLPRGEHVDELVALALPPVAEFDQHDDGEGGS